MRSTTLILAFNLLLAVSARAQSNEELYKQGMEYKAQYKYVEGLLIFQKLVKADTSNVDYLSNCSYFYSRAGHLMPEKDQKKYYTVATYLARKAVTLDEKNAGAHYALALALGRMNENAGNSQKIANAKRIKLEAERAIQLDPKQAGAYHILGRWHREIAGLSGIKKAAINSFYGGVPPGGSFEESVKAFQNAIGIEPKYMLHYYELAMTYAEMDKADLEKDMLKKALQCPVQTPDDPETKKKCEGLLKKL